jgi:biotin synthase-related radical SAM superfamily protein
VFSPEYVSISQASAIALRLRSGRFYRDARPTCANLLLTYADTCLANCAYCGLARGRPAGESARSFIRVEWPVISTAAVLERLARYAPEVKRVCLSMVTHGRAYADALRLVDSIRGAVDTPLSVLIAPNLFNRRRLEEMKAAGVDMIGIGLDATSPQVFEQRRGRAVAGPLSWSQYWDIVEQSAEIFGPGKVNCHVVTGLGETDADTVATLERLQRLGVVGYLFSFYPEAESRMGRTRRPAMVRWRRLQLVKHLLENGQLAAEQLGFDGRGRIARIDAERAALEPVVASGLPFMTDGCPGDDGAPACNRPFGSYRPGEAFRDYPFVPAESDLVRIRRELRLEDVLRPVGPQAAAEPVLRGAT